MNIGDKVTVTGTVVGGLDSSGKVGIHFDGAGLPYCVVDPAAVTVTKTAPVEAVAVEQVVDTTVADNAATVASVASDAVKAGNAASEAEAATQRSVIVMPPAQEQKQAE